MSFFILTPVPTTSGGTGTTVQPTAGQVPIGNADGTYTPGTIGGGSGTVTSVSVVSANGLAGTVANATTTPAITLSTSVSGILKGDATTISAASAGTDYQAPITLTTSGTSGAATFIGNTLNIPQYSGGGGGGVTTITFGSTGLTPSTATSGAVTVAGTLAVANGGTGVTTSSGATSVVLRDANNNITANAFFNSFNSITASGTTVTLTVTSAPVQYVSGSGGQTIKLPDATTLPNGTIFSFNNNQSSGAITVNNNSNTLIVSVPSGGYTTVVLLSNATAAGTWDRHDQTPSNVSWSTNTLDYPGSITSATWNGSTITVGKGGTGLTSGTSGGVLYYSATGTLASSAALASNALVVGGGAGAAPATVTTGTGVVTALGVNTGSAGAFVVNGGALGTPSSGTVTNLTGTASININGTVGATTPAAGTFTSVGYKGATSGTVTLTAPAVAGSQSYTLPSAVPAVNGYALTSTTAGVMSWAAASGSPGGTSTQVQYNNSGSFGGISGFTTDGTRVTASTTIGVGGATPSTSGAGITFPATQSASTDVNTLDDYEEGTWTVNLTSSSPGSLSVSATTQLASYVKIGKFVSANFSLTFNITKGSASGDVLITGFPFAFPTANDRYTGSLGFINNLGTTDVLGLLGSGSSTNSYIGRVSGGTLAITAITDGNSRSIRGQVSYEIS
jgi:hypothetical protein